MTELNKKFFERNAERVRAMSDADCIAALQRAGVLGADGKLAERYRSSANSEPVSPQTTPVTHQ